MSSSSTRSFVDPEPILHDLRVAGVLLTVFTICTTTGIEASLPSASVFDNSLSRKPVWLCA